MLTPEKLHIRTLGDCKMSSTVKAAHPSLFIPDETRLLCKIDYIDSSEINCAAAFEKAGPRRKIFFRPEYTRAAIVTCGGLCPGLNNVIRSLVVELHHRYGVRDIVGARNGYQGLNPDYGRPLVDLTLERVEHIEKLGGTILGSSRGPQPVDVMVDFLEREKIDILFCVGGDGTLRGAHEICEEVARRKARIGVVGIPKTIDNDIHYVWRSFGYVTALEKAREVLEGAHIEAKGSPNGVGLVKLMGRDAGFIAAGATIASQHVNFTLAPEIPFELEGKNGFLEHLKRRILSRHHALVVVAEGAGQNLFQEADHRLDASGNRRHSDIGVLLRREIERFFDEREIPVSMKYFDPSYHIRSAPASVSDALLCDQLARNAAHAAMAGKTDLIIGLWNNHCVHVPIALATAEKRYMSERGEIWNSVLAATGQPSRFA